VSLAVLLALCAMLPGRAGEPSGEKKASAGKADEQPAKKPRVHVTISKETTYITGPLRKDGYVDYVAAFNERCSQGVMPENNASVLFWKVAGPAEIPKPTRERFFKLLGIPPLPEKGDYFVALDGYVKRLQDAGKLPPPRPGKEVMEDLWDQESQAMERPWSKKEFPVLAAWLATNEKSLALLVEASKRPRKYNPVTCGDMISVIGEFLPPIQQSREFARILLVRAMLRLEEGRVEEAWGDLLSCHRLARLVGQRPMLIDALVAMALDGMACSGDKVLLQHVRLTAAQAAKMRRDLGTLPPLVDIAATIDLGERFLSLDFASTGARQGLASFIELLTTGGFGTLAKPLVNLAGDATIDWNVMLRLDNAWCDRFVDAYRKPTHAERKEALRKIDEEIRKLAQEAKDMKSLAWSMLANPRQAISQRLGESLVAVFLPGISAVADADDRAVMQLDLTKLAFALAAFRDERGSYPAELVDLVPKHVAQLPKDFFLAADLHYRREGDGYTLYSVGLNGKDDGGKGYEDRKGNEDWDDLVVRVPGPAKQQRQEKKP
jgi:hypothetical protein